MYDYTIIGAGIFGSVFARAATDAGFSCKIYDKRPHVGGNCYTEKAKDGYDIHVYGPHIFHTNSDDIWEFAKRYTSFNSYVHRQAAINGGTRYQFPINLNTLEQVFGTDNTLEKFKESINKNPKRYGNTIEDWCLNNIGPDLYRLFIRDYVFKHWGRPANTLPDLIVKRLKFNFDRNNNFYANKYQGIPVNGYTEFFNAILDGIDVEVEKNIDYKLIESLEKKTRRKIVYTGALDEFFNFSKGRLDWRSLIFNNSIVKTSIPIQPHSIETYNDLSTSLTRSSEFWHFNPSKKLTESVITKELAADWNPDMVPMYPINTEKNNELVRVYSNMIDKSKYIFGGRLATYKYYNMDQVIGSALKSFENEIL